MFLHYVESFFLCVIVRECNPTNTGSLLARNEASSILLPYVIRERILLQNFCTSLRRDRRTNPFDENNFLPSSSNVDDRDFYIQNSYSSGKKRDVASRKTIRSQVIIN